MKLQELIKRLVDIYIAHGDMKVEIPSGHHGDVLFDEVEAVHYDALDKSVSLSD